MTLKTEKLLHEGPGLTTSWRYSSASETPHLLRIFERVSDFVEPGEEATIAMERRFEPIAFYVPIDLAPHFDVKSIESGYLLKEDKNESSALFGWTCKHDECLGTARDVDDAPLSTAVQARSMMRTCLHERFEPKERALRRYLPGVDPPYLTNLTFVVRNTSNEIRRFRIVIIGYEENALRQFSLGMGMVPVAPGARVVLNAMSQLSVRPTRLVVPDAIATRFLIHSLRIGNREQFVSPGPVPATAFAGSAIAVSLTLPIVTAGTQVSLEVENICEELTNFAATLFCDSVPTRQEGSNDELLRQELADVEITAEPAGTLFSIPPETDRDVDVDLVDDAFEDEYNTGEVEALDSDRPVGSGG